MPSGSDLGASCVVGQWNPITSHFCEGSVVVTVFTVLLHCQCVSLLFVTLWCAVMQKHYNSYIHKRWLENKNRDSLWKSVNVAHLHLRKKSECWLEQEGCSCSVISGLLVPIPYCTLKSLTGLQSWNGRVSHDFRWYVARETPLFQYCESSVSKPHWSNATEISFG